MITENKITAKKAENKEIIILDQIEIFAKNLTLITSKCQKSF